MKNIIQSADFSARVSDLYNDVDATLSDIMSYPLDTPHDIADKRNFIATQLNYALCELSDAYQIFCDLHKHFYNLHELEHNVEFKSISHENK